VTNHFGAGLGDGRARVHFGRASHGFGRMMAAILCAWGLVSTSAAGEPTDAERLIDFVGPRKPDAHSSSSRESELFPVHSRTNQHEENIGAQMAAIRN
jgi:hypothetical protein